MGCNNLATFNVVRLTMEIFLVSLTITGNILVILSILLVKVLKKPKNYLLLSLAVADLLIGALILPSKILMNFKCEIWIAKHVNCYILVPISVDVFFCSSSILGLLLIALDRYVAISCPLYYKIHITTQKILAAVCVKWLVAFGSAIPYWAFSHTLNNPYMSSVCLERQSDWTRIALTLFSFFVPLTLVLGTYGKIWCILRIRKRRRYSGRALHPNSTFHAVSRKALKNYIIRQLHEKKGYAMLGTMVGCFVFSWLPFFTLIIFISASDLLGKVFSPPAWIYEALLWLGYSNSSMNPFVYTMFSSHFRQAFKKFLTCQCTGVNESMRSQTNSKQIGRQTLSLIQECVTTL